MTSNELVIKRQSVSTIIKTYQKGRVEAKKRGTAFNRKLMTGKRETARSWVDDNWPVTL